VLVWILLLWGMNNFQHQLQQSRLLQWPEAMLSRSTPFAPADARMAHLNRQLLLEMGIDIEDFMASELPALLTDKQGSILATLYAGHQFGIYTSRLGDGRVHTVGDIQHRNSELWEIQLKGAGATEYARGNHGRMSLAEAITEYLGCEALAGLGIASTRGMAIVLHQTPMAKGLDIQQQCILFRTAPSHLRFGHFEYLHNQAEHELLKQLCDMTIEQFFPQLLQEQKPQRYLAWLYHIAKQTAELIAQWQAVGFAHSVLNTDNMSLLGLSIDLGVYGFMQEYDPRFSANQADEENRYAFNQQVEVGRWNVMALAEALSTLLPQQRIPASLLRHYNQAYKQHWLMLMRRKLGLYTAAETDAGLLEELLTLMQTHTIDYSRLFRRLSQQQLDQLQSLGSAAWQQDIASWWHRYQARTEKEAVPLKQRMQSMRSINPNYTLRAQHLARVIRAAEDEHNFAPLHELLVTLQSPYSEHRSYQHLA
jgi:uncharacterized protein YdiU (UPF0061 family)